MKDKRITVGFTEGLYNKIRYYAEQRRETLSEFVVKCVYTYITVLEKHQNGKNE